MSLLVVLFYWVAIPVLVFLLARRIYRNATTLIQRNIVVLATTIVYGGLLWIAVGEKWWLDHQVRELCAKDGGVRVYETVKLPAEKIAKYKSGRIRIPVKTDVIPESFFYHEDTVKYLRQNRLPEDGGVDLLRHHYKLYRVSDNKLVGESISYSRRGGDLPGPWHPSSFSCPQPKELNLLEQVFVTQ